MIEDKNEIYDALNTSIRDLQHEIDTHRYLIDTLMGDESKNQSQRAALKNGSESKREVQLKSAILDAIEVLDESRKAFKSKTLEALRKKLTQLLIDMN